MKSAVETLSPTRAKLTVEVPFEELKPSLDAAYKKIAQQINVPGFRPVGSEERMTFGSGGEAHTLVADTRGDRQRGGVSATGADVARRV